MRLESKPICCIETGRIYKSHADASKELGVSNACFYKYFKGEMKSIRGYHWEHINLEDTTMNTEASVGEVDSGAPENRTLYRNIINRNEMNVDL